MFRTETAIWEALKVGFTIRGALAYRIDSKIGPRGLPDVYFGHHDRQGWVELKASLVEPADDSPFNIPSMTSFQRKWLKAHDTMHGNCWVLAAMEDRLFLFHAEIVGLLGSRSWGFFKSQGLLIQGRGSREMALMAVDEILK